MCGIFLLIDFRLRRGLHAGIRHNRWKFNASISVIHEQAGIGTQFP